MTGIHREISTLPANLLPSKDERDALEKYAEKLMPLLDQTPRNRGEYEALMLTAVTNLLLSKPSQMTNSLGAGARADAYMDALDDVTHWAVREAIRKWNRGECGLDERGESRDYRWAPDTATLRRLAIEGESFVRGRASVALRIAKAEPIDIDPPHEHKARMSAAWRGLLKALRSASLRKETKIDDLVKMGN